jgi:hypothetical protein
MQTDKEYVKKVKAAIIEDKKFLVQLLKKKGVKLVVRVLTAGRYYSAHSAPRVRAYVTWRTDWHISYFQRRELAAAIVKRLKSNLDNNVDVQVVAK